jgi:hypothetical protein
MDKSRPNRQVPEAPAIKVDRCCPNCGRETAVVFPFVPVGVKAEDAKLVCLACCPTNPHVTDVGIEHQTD